MDDRPQPGGLLTTSIASCLPQGTRRPPLCFGNGAVTSGVLATDPPASDEGFRKRQERFHENHGVRTPTSRYRDGAELKPVALEP